MESALSRTCAASLEKPDGFAAGCCGEAGFSFGRGGSPLVFIRPPKSSLATRKISLPISPEVRREVEGRSPLCVRSKLILLSGGVYGAGTGAN